MIYNQPNCEREYTQICSKRDQDLAQHGSVFDLRIGSRQNVFGRAGPLALLGSPRTLAVPVTRATKWNMTQHPAPSVLMCIWGHGGQSFSPRSCTGQTSDHIRSKPYDRLHTWNRKSTSDSTCHRWGLPRPHHPRINSQLPVKGWLASE